MMLQLHGCRFDLGNKPPQVNGIKVYKNQAVKDQVIIEADFVWAGNNDVQLVVKPIPKTLGGIEAVGKAIGNLISLRVSPQALLLTCFGCWLTLLGFYTRPCSAWCMS